MNLQCRKCGEQIEVPEEALSTTQPRVTCPGCSTSYRLRPRQDSTQADPALRAADADSQAGPPASEGREQPTFEPGQIVADRYRVVRFIAQGGMGEVYEAEDVELLQTVALKTISSRVGEESGILDRFKREIALARTVTHPNVCRIFDLGTHRTAGEQVNFLTMELLRGETLSELLRRRHRLSTTEALPLIEQICAGLDAAHRARVVHRDLKSENVYLEGSSEARQLSELRVVLTDFGVARGTDAGDRFASQVTGLGIVGTPAYMAPEQVENKVITSKADLYSLGIVIYEMVTGHLPFEAESPLTTAVKRLREAPSPPHVHVPDLPAWWERTILRCLERRPEERFPDALAVASALQKPYRPSPTLHPAGAENSGRLPVTQAPKTAKRFPRPEAGQVPTPAGTPGSTLHGGIAIGGRQVKGKRLRLWLGAGLVLVLALLGTLVWLDSDDSVGAVVGNPVGPAHTNLSQDVSEDETEDATTTSGMDSIDQAQAFESSAEIARRQGNLSAALGLNREALELWSEVHRPRDELACYVRLIGILLDRGEIEEASELQIAALDLAAELDEPATRPALLYQQGRLAALRGDLEAATRHHEEALDLGQRVGIVGLSLDSRLALARIDLDSGLPDRAELLAKEALEEAERTGERAKAMRATALLIEALAGNERTDEAAALSEMAAVWENLEAAEAQMELDLARAQLAAAALPASYSRSEIGAVLDTFDTLAGRATGYGLRPLAMRIRLQQAVIAFDRSSNRREEAKGRLRVVETEARAAGLLYFADRAESILQTEI